MQYEEEDTDGHHSMKISFDNTNYNDQTVDMVSTCFDTRLVKLLYSKYLSKANIKEDILLDKINDDKIEYNGTITLDTNKFYIVKIDLKDWEGDPSTGLALV
ncbi:MAG: hypothetical protein MJ233_03545 [Mycoplasmoidaceae bacterium]|nr:hypothetical protein [Mycoplasmoidaceae bacterium]